jgi:hypothetical protein
MNGEAIPAVMFGAIALLSGIWKIVDFVRDERVRRAEKDAADEHQKLLKAIDENEQLRVNLAQAQAQLRARHQGES